MQTSHDSTTAFDSSADRAGQDGPSVAPVSRRPASYQLDAATGTIEALGQSPQRFDVCLTLYSLNETVESEMSLRYWGGGGGLFIQTFWHRSPISRNQLPRKG